MSSSMARRRYVVLVNHKTFYAIELLWEGKGGTSSSPPLPGELHYSFL
jgi:hypothetical protein